MSDGSVYVCVISTYKSYTWKAVFYMITYIQEILKHREGIGLAGLHSGPNITSSSAQKNSSFENWSSVSFHED